MTIGQVMTYLGVGVEHKDNLQTILDGVLALFWGTIGRDLSAKTGIVEYYDG